MQVHHAQGKRSKTRLAPTTLSPIEPTMDRSPLPRSIDAALRYLALAVHEADQRTAQRPCDQKSASASYFDSHTNNLTILVFHHSLTGGWGIVLREQTRAARSIRGRAQAAEGYFSPEMTLGDRRIGAWESDDGVLARKGKIRPMRNLLFTNEMGCTEMMGDDRERFLQSHVLVAMSQSCE